MKSFATFKSAYLINEVISLINVKLQFSFFFVKKPNLNIKNFKKLFKKFED